VRLRALAPIALAALLVVASWSVAVSGSAQSVDFTVSIDETRYMGNNEACIEFSTNPPQPGATYTVTVQPFGVTRIGALDANGRGATQHTVEEGQENTVTVEVTSGDTTRQVSKTFVPGPPGDPAVCEPSQQTASPSPSPTSSADPSASPSPSPSASSSSPSPSPSPSASPAPSQDPRCDIPGVICGTSGDDRLVGTHKDDVIIGRGGNDTINGRGGEDQLEGGSGRDAVNGGSGNDRMKGGSGSDSLRGKGGRDRLDGGRGKDVCFGGPGRDRTRRC